MKKYGLTVEDRNILVQNQNGRCKICEIAEEESGPKGLVVDHDHATNKVRGLLCNACNIALGFFKDNVSILQNAIKYLG